MIRKPDHAAEPSSRRLAAVLVPVVVGGLLGIFASLATTAYSTWVAEKEIIRKEHASHLERAMELCAKYSNDLGRLLGIGLLTKGNADSQSLDVMSAPTNTLLELRAVATLHLPALRADVEELFRAHGALMQRYDQVIGSRGEHDQEDAAAFAQRLNKEMAPVVERVNALMNKIGELAQREVALSAARATHVAEFVSHSGRMGAGYTSQPVQSVGSEPA